MGVMARIASTLKQKYREEKATIQGVGLSKARMVKQARDIPEIALQLRINNCKAAPTPIIGANVKMGDGQPMTFFTDGSLRNGYGPKPEMSGRQFRKLRKRVRRNRKAAEAIAKVCDCHIGEANIANHRAGCPKA